jgi:serine protease Do
VIVGFNGKPIANSAELPLAVADVRPGESARVRVWRKGAIKDLAVVVGEAPQERIATRLQR